MYSLRRKLYTNYTQTLHSNFTQSPTKRRSKPYTASVQTPTQRAFAKLYTRRNTNPTFCFWTRMERMERIVRNVCNERDERDERNKRNERKTGNGNRRWHASSLLQVTQKKSNNFERFFGDLTLTFLTFGNTFRLSVLPTRRIIFLCLPLI